MYSGSGSGIIVLTTSTCSLSTQSNFNMRRCDQYVCMYVLDVLDCISRARVNKIYVMQSLFRNFEVDDLMYPHGQEPLSEFKKSVDIGPATSPCFCREE